MEPLRRLGFSMTSTASIGVLTSGRTQARAPQGFGAYLLALGREPAGRLGRLTRGKPLILRARTRGPAVLSPS